ncbi:MAG: tetratricopeptide repeat protein, partial [Betaproteobacteria bacterium]
RYRKRAKEGAMSLLLDALRRAEEARRAKEAENNSAQSAASITKSAPEMPEVSPDFPAPEFALAEEPPATSTKNTIAATQPAELLPFNAYDSSLSLEAVASPPVVSPRQSKIVPVATYAEPHPVSQPPPISQNTAQQEIARNVFAAKQPNSQLATESGGRKWLLPAVAVIVVVLGAAVWYVWHEIDKISRPNVARASSPPPSALPPAAPSTGQIDNKQPVPLEPAPKIDQLPLPPLLPPPAIEPPAPKLAAIPASERAMTERETLARKLKDAPIAKEAEVGLKLSRSYQPARINPELTAAYNALAAGDYTSAVQQYRKLAAAEPLNIDVQLGLATAAARIGDKTLATQHYRRVLALDPRNGLAIMGLVALNDGVPPATLEIELKTLIGRNPEAAPLQFALGNLYSGALRWTEAQQAYFEAFRLDPQNADYLFNLAVSLDQLKQTRLALDYYRKAEGIARAGGGGQFDRGGIAKRIRELSEAARVN